MPQYLMPQYFFFIRINGMLFFNEKLKKLDFIQNKTFIKLVLTRLIIKILLSGPDKNV